MISITERLRARHEPVGDGTGTWRPDGLCQEAADTIDALIGWLEYALERSEYESDRAHLRAALSKARGKQE